MELGSQTGKFLEPNFSERLIFFIILAKSTLKVIIFEIFLIFQKSVITFCRDIMSKKIFDLDISKILSNNLVFRDQLEQKTIQ